MGRSSISDQAYKVVFGQSTPAATGAVDEELIKKYLK